MDRNDEVLFHLQQQRQSLSARRAWIEMFLSMGLDGRFKVALRKESVDRNTTIITICIAWKVALRKESVDRNYRRFGAVQHSQMSLSARRAWIEIYSLAVLAGPSGRRSPQGERG